MRKMSHSNELFSEIPTVEHQETCKILVPIIYFDDRSLLRRGLDLTECLHLIVAIMEHFLEGIYCSVKTLVH